MNKIKQKFLKRKKTYITLGVLLLLVLFFLVRGDANGIERTASVIRTDLTTFVKVSGTVVPERRVEMAFERSGTVSTVLKEVGDSVQRGDVIAIVNAGEAQASYLQTEARFRELQRGTRGEELAVSEAEYGSTVQAAEAAQLKLNASAYAALSEVEEAFSDSIDSLFDNPRSSLPKLKMQFVSPTKTRDAEARRVQMEQMMRSWRATANTNTAVNPNLALNNTREVRQFVEFLVLELDNLRKQNSESQALAEIATYRSELIEAQNTLASTYEALAATAKEYEAAITAKNVSQQTLALKQAGTSAEELDRARAELSQASADRSKYMIIAPFSGLITKQDAKVGQYIQGGTIVTAVMSDEPYKIESFVPEISIGEIKVGQKVAVEVEALPDVTLTGTVTRIEPTETLIDDVSNYKVTMSFDQNENVRSGMTVNTTIATGLQPSVLAIPREFITKEAGKNLVHMEDAGDKIITREITTGVSSDDGLIEVIAGLEEGNVVLKLKK